MISFQKLLNLGTSSETTPLNQYYIRINNSINLLYIFGVSIPLIAAVFLLTHDGLDSYGRFFILIAFSSCSLLLSKINQVRYAKILTSVTPFFTIIVFPIFVSRFVHAGMFLWIPYAIMTMGAIPFFIFSFEKEKFIMLSLVGLHAIFVLVFDELIMAYYKDLADLWFVDKYYLYYVFAKVAITFLLYAAFFAFKLMYHKNRMLLLNLTKELDQKNQTLNSLNASLENKIAERTAKLTLQNERIKNLAHTNAHEIRAYIVRIMGLLNLKNQNTTQEEKEYCDAKILENISDLDKITQRLSRELVEENLNDKA